MAETRGEKRANAGRTQLKGVLEGLVQQSKEEREVCSDEIVVDDDVEEGARDLMELPYRRGSEDVHHTRRRRGKSPPIRRRRKRARKEYLPSPDGSDSNPEHNGERHTHVMTLFDRKVDLARFTPDTPLYVMCREWMCNNPEKLGSDIITTNQHVAGGGKNQTTEKEIHSLPVPTPLPTDGDGHVVRLDIPEPLPPHGDTGELDGYLEKTGDGGEDEISDYKKQHMKRWKDIKTRWRRSSATNQQRFSESVKTLREMFQRQ